MTNTNNRVVYFNGEFCNESEVKISLFDSTLVTGEKCIEVTRTYNKKPHKLEKHLERLYIGLTTLNINPHLSINEIIQITIKTLNINIREFPDVCDWQIIHHISKGKTEIFELFEPQELNPTILIHCIPLTNRLAKLSAKYNNGIDIVMVEQRMIPSNIIPQQIKSNGRLDHLIARTQAAKINPKATALLLSDKGFVAECSGSSFFIVSNGIIKTAPPDVALDGITKSTIISIANSLKIPVIEENFTIEEIYKCEEAFITSTIIGMIFSRSFQGTLINEGNIGKITSSIRERLFQEIGLDFVKQADHCAHPERITNSL